LLPEVTAYEDCLGVEHLTDSDIWYVSYRTNITPKRDDGERRSARATRKFKTEAAAKQFAEQIIRDGWSAIAGTLNPHTPKKTVASTQILDWIAGKHWENILGTGICPRLSESNAVIRFAESRGGCRNAENDLRRI
jgi:hypothetical protein